MRANPERRSPKPFDKLYDRRLLIRLLGVRLTRLVPGNFPDPASMKTPRSLSASTNRSTQSAAALAPPLSCAPRAPARRDPYFTLGYNRFPLPDPRSCAGPGRQGKRFFVRQSFSRGYEPRLKAAFLLRAYETEEKALFAQHFVIWGPAGLVAPTRMPFCTM